MGERGPQRKSAAYLQINGSRIEDGRGIAMPPRTPSKPDWVGVQAVASAVWDETIDDLARVPGLLCELDAGALALYCDAWQQYREASAIVATSGIVATSEKGGQYQHPAVGIRNKSRDAIIKLGAKFGLDPQSREGLIVTGDTEDDELARLIQ
jgi:P27 family predicted phage terminase small subunit